ncbi:uncharacterized protein A1O5_08203 [Cladophialophora psammophila CBS 110553]|uniref:Uncharacterized protein n=1 Tax=Cladophialophora psammophila CBS 110553 TaxID=1182543 RepID=W9WUW0_9EURO|nr:uncharacterized protein A1O5_08203 [Cladophialophora psammophila CBS 110553]EXJ68411.1 hypothetical protein A1O5_08203 [Cladophialophora psammophila CBS 110553]
MDDRRKTTAKARDEIAEVAAISYSTTYAKNNAATKTWTVWTKIKDGVEPAQPSRKRLYDNIDLAPTEAVDTRADKADKPNQGQNELDLLRSAAWNPDDGEISANSDPILRALRPAIGGTFTRCRASVLLVSPAQRGS